MIKKFIFILLIFVFLFGLTGCSTADNSKTGPAAKAAMAYFYEANLDAPVENVEVLNVEMADKEHAIVKIKVSFGKGAWMSSEPSEENYKVFLEKFGDEWEVQFVL